MIEKTKVAVLFGGLSSEHDVSVLTGLEALEALDPGKYEGFPVYVGLDGQWWVGDALRDRKNYIPDLTLKRQLVRMSLDVGNSREGGRPVLREVGGGLLKKAKVFAFDVALIAMHGTWGEDGTVQGVLAAEGIPFAGGNVSAMGLTINKIWTAQIAKATGLPVLESVLVWRGETPDAKALKALGKFPLFVKPNYLGSSIGAQVVQDAEELEVALDAIFRLDVAAIIQPCVANLVEYNLSVRRLRDGEIVTSCIERPLRKGESYSFKDKYLSQGVDSKLSGASAGLVSATRVLNPPELDGKRDSQIREWASALFEVLDLAGTPRLDFLCNEKTGELYFNEINPLPGSFAYFLWEQGVHATGFSQLLDDVLTEAKNRQKTKARVIDPVATGGGIFRKRGV